MRILVRVTYGYYVIERILQRSTNDEVKVAVRAEAIKNFKHIGVNSLKTKWMELLEKTDVGNTHYSSGGYHSKHGSKEQEYFRDY